MAVDIAAEIHNDQALVETAKEPELPSTNE